MIPKTMTTRALNELSTLSSELTDQVGSGDVLEGLEGSGLNISEMFSSIEPIFNSRNGKEFKFCIGFRIQ